MSKTKISNCILYGIFFIFKVSPNQIPKSVFSVANLDLSSVDNRLPCSYIHALFSRFSSERSMHFVFVLLLLVWCTLCCSWKFALSFVVLVASNAFCVIQANLKWHDWSQSRLELVRFFAWLESIMNGVCEFEMACTHARFVSWVDSNSFCLACIELMNGVDELEMACEICNLSWLSWFFFCLWVFEWTQGQAQGLFFSFK